MSADLCLVGARVLVVEDVALLAFELIDNLEAVGAVPLGPIASVEAAVRYVETGEPIDAALLNVMLRRQLAFPVADALRRRGIPFVFVTGNDSAVREHFPDVPVHPKPADMVAVVRTLAAVVSRSASMS